MEQTKGISLSTKEIGQLGEKIAAGFLMKQGFSILQRNYWKKWGEIDIVARTPVTSQGNVLGETSGKIHFVEVKSVSYETKQDLEYAVTHETWRPEELVHQFKLHQIHKALETWLIENNYDGDWQIDVAAVRLVPHETFASVNIIENIT